MVPTINSPAQLSRDEVAVRTVLCWILVHAAEKAFLTRIIGYTQLREYRIDLHQNGPIERIDGCQIVVVVLSGIRHRLILCRNSRGSRTLNTGYIFYEFAVSQRKHHSSGARRVWERKRAAETNKLEQRYEENQACVLVQITSQSFNQWGLERRSCSPRQQVHAFTLLINAPSSASSPQTNNFVYYLSGDCVNGFRCKLWLDAVGATVCGTPHFGVSFGSTYLGSSWDFLLLMYLGFGGEQQINMRGLCRVCIVAVIPAVAEKDCWTR